MASEQAKLIAAAVSVGRSALATTQVRADGWVDNTSSSCATRVYANLGLLLENSSLSSEALQSLIPRIPNKIIPVEEFSMAKRA